MRALEKAGCASTVANIQLLPKIFRSWMHPNCGPFKLFQGSLTSAPQVHLNVLT